jgi:hypothetical protein
MAKTELVPMTAHVPKWVKYAFVRCAKAEGRTVSSIAAQILEEDCADDPENPRNQPSPDVREPSGAPFAPPDTVFCA